MPRVDLNLFKPKTNSFNGIYRGVIEDNNDPEMLGRCKIRIWGIHTDVKEASVLEGIPTRNLPWSEPCLGLLEGSVSGAGMFSVPLKGSHVFLFFEGGNWQSPRYFATVPGQPVDAPDPRTGFNDPSGAYPRADRLGESDYHRLARGQSSGTIVDHKNQYLDSGVVKADEETWDEPPSAYAAQYPKNIVLATHRGIILELDNTEGQERVHIFHPSNTYIEIDKDGNVVFRNDGNRFEITRGVRNKHVLVDDNETIESNKTTRVGQTETRHIGLDQKETVVNNRETIIGVDDKESVGRNVENIVGNNVENSVGKDVTENIGRDWTVACGGNITFSAEGVITMLAPRIDFNPGSPPLSPALLALVPIDNIQSGVDTTEVVISQVSEDHEPDISGITGIFRAPMSSMELAAYTSMGVNPETETNPQPTATDETPQATPPAEVPSDCTDIYDAETGGTLNGEFQLSSRFKLKHLTTNCAVSNYPLIAQNGLLRPDIACNMRKLCTNVLEPISDRYGVPSITSGFRQASGTSNHNTGSAVDIQWSGISDEDYYERISWIKENLKWCELILEYGGNRPWLHVAYNTAKSNTTNFKTRVMVANGYQRGFLKLRNVPRVGGV